MPNLVPLTLSLLFSLSFVFGQQKIDSTLAYQTEPLKGFSLYIPSGYDPAVAHPLMLAFHPFSPGQWDAISWRDTLTAFAEANQLILLCPDGGADGKIDDPIDTSFTTFLLDQMADWYHIHPGRVYVMGFSWGGRAVYTYGLSHASRFAGFLPIGAAIDGTNQIGGLLSHAAGKPFYLIHGSGDSPSIRFYPAMSALESGQACVAHQLLAGVGPTFNFPNRNEILNQAYTWLQTTTCTKTVGLDTDLLIGSGTGVFPNPVAAGSPFRVSPAINNRSWDRGTLTTVNGQLISLEIQPGGDFRTASPPPPGIYLLSLWAGKNRVCHKLSIY